VPGVQNPHGSPPRAPHQQRAARAGPGPRLQPCHQRAIPPRQTRWSSTCKPPRCSPLTDPHGSSRKHPQPAATMPQMQRQRRTTSRHETPPVGSARAHTETNRQTHRQRVTTATRNKTGKQDAGAKNSTPDATYQQAVIFGGPVHTRQGAACDSGVPRCHRCQTPAASHAVFPCTAHRGAAGVCPMGQVPQLRHPAVPLLRRVHSKHHGPYRTAGAASPQRGLPSCLPRARPGGARSTWFALMQQHQSADAQSKAPLAATRGWCQDTG
jgi:hypothetical protein